MSPHSGASMSGSHPPGRGIAALFMRFAAAGAVGTAAHYAVLVALVSAAGLAGWVASVAGSFVGALVNYAINYFWVFDSRPGHAHAFPRFMAVAGIGLAVNAAAMFLLTVHAGVHYLVAQVLATALVLVVGFLLNARWTFGSKR